MSPWMLYLFPAPAFPSRSRTFGMKTSLIPADPNNYPKTSPLHKKKHATLIDMYL